MKDFAIGLIAWLFIIIMGLRIFSNENPFDNIGKTIIILNEEYMITDYSYVTCRYNLNNGAVINKNLVEELLKE